MKFSFNRMARHGLLCGAATLALAGNTHAAVYSGSWDPNFGAPFTNLGWRATAQFYVPDACAAAVGTGSLGVDTYGSTANCGGIELRNTLVEFYDVTDPDKVAIDTLTVGKYTALTSCDEYGCSFLDDQFIDSVDFVDGIVTGFVTSFSLFNFTDGSFVTGRGFGLDAIICGANPDPLCLQNYEFALKLTLQTTSSGPNAAGSALLARDDNGTSSSSNTPNVQFGLIPEPGGLALVGAALGALALTRRRRPTA
jgi:hypothetical protein